MDDMVKNACIDAEIGGIRLFLNMPDIIIKDFGEQLDELKEEIENAEDTDE